MTSTAVDVGLCILLISAAAVTVANSSTDPARTDRADEVASTLASTTATVNYSLELPPSSAVTAGRDGGVTGNEPPESALERTAHGTLASLLARAAVQTVRVHGSPPTRTAAGFAAAVRHRTLAVLPPRTQVVVRWEPYPGAHLGRTLLLGPDPPRQQSVNAATVVVPAGIPAASAGNAGTDASSFDSLANGLASAIVAGLFPPDRMRHALAGDYPVDALAAHRYRRFAEAYGVVLGDSLGRADVETANARLAEGLSEQIERDLRRRFQTPTRAADRVDSGRVHIVVRTWSQ